MSQVSFYTNEAVSLEKTIDLKQPLTKTKLEDLECVYEIEKCVGWIKSNGYKKVCLQFPDHLLPDSSEVAIHLQEKTGEKIYILGDTAYESCCIDYIAAAHVDADAIIHFGPICFSQTSGNVPYLNIHEKHELDVENLRTALAHLISDEESLLILVDTPYVHMLDEIEEKFKCDNIQIHRTDRIQYLPAGKKMVYLGSPGRKLTNIILAFQPEGLYWFTDCLEEYVMDTRVLKKRNYLIERIKDSKTIGIVIGTLAVKNYLNVIDRMKKLVSSSGKKYYIISVGKPTVAKMANFSELDLYVMITCSMNEIYDSRDYYKPIATPFDVEMALNVNASKMSFSYDYNLYLSHCGEIMSKENLMEGEGDVSLLTNNVRTMDNAEGTNGTATHGSNQIMLRSDGTLALNASHGAGYLANRTWKGLEQNLGCNEPEKASIGRSGRATKYSNELQLE